MIMLKKKVINLSTQIFQRRAGLFDIVDEIGLDLKKYVYMVKQVCFRYKEINRSIAMVNREYCGQVWSYNLSSGEIHTDFPNLSKEEKQRIKKLVDDRGLPFNDTTYYEAYKYAIRKGFITTVKKNR